MVISPARASTAIAAAGLLVALLACKKEEEAPPPVETATAAPEPTPSAEPVAEKKDDEVKRYPDKETAESGTVRVLLDNLRVYKEADTTTDFIATLNRGTLVNLKARYGNYLLIEYPSGVKQLSPGWILARRNSPQLKNETDIKPEDVAAQDAGVVVPSATASASAAPSASVTASAEPSATASAEPTASASATTAPKLRLPNLRLKPSATTP